MAGRGTRRCSDPGLARRTQRARQLFVEWTGVTNPELAAALWNNLNGPDRQHWLKLAGEDEGDR